MQQHYIGGRVKEAGRAVLKLNLLKMRWPVIRG